MNYGVPSTLCKANDPKDKRCNKEEKAQKKQATQACFLQFFRDHVPFTMRCVEDEKMKWLCVLSMRCLFSVVLEIIVMNDAQ